ncbi:MAG: hypothetical protein ACREBJ_08550, partial [Nitrosotalea sp.]
MKTFHIVIIVLCVSLSWSLNNAFATSYAISDGSSCTVIGTWNEVGICTLTRSLTINSGETLIINTGKSLDIPEGVTLTNSGNIIINSGGTISNSG